MTGSTKYRRLVATAVLLYCAGCNTGFMQYVRQGFKVGPNYGRPAAPIESDWIDAADERLGSHEWPAISHWWTAFESPVLNELVYSAYQQNLTLRQAGFRILQARAERNIQVGNMFPQQQGAYGAYSRNSLSLERANTNYIQNQFFDQWDVGFNLSWELDFWGRFRRAVEAADADLDASVEHYDDILVTLIGDTASTYVELRTLQHQLGLTLGNVELQRETYRLAKARFDEGATSELDVNQAQSNLSQTESDVPQLRIAIRQAEVRLCILLGIPPEELTRRLGPGPIPIPPPTLAVGIPAELLARRPDIRRAERLCAAQCARIGIAESAMYPHISINGNLGWSAEHAGDLFNSASLISSVVPQFQWAILNYGRLQNNVLLQDARFQELIAAYQQTVLDAQGDVEKALVLYVRSWQRAAHLATSVDASQKAVEVALAQFAEGAVDFNRVVVLQQDLLQQQVQLAQSHGNIALGMINVYQALGGGWEIRCQGGPIMPGAPVIIEQLPPPEATQAPLEVALVKPRPGVDSVPASRSPSEPVGGPRVGSVVAPGQEPLIKGPALRRSVPVLSHSHSPVPPLKGPEVLVP